LAEAATGVKAIKAMAKAVSLFIYNSSKEKG
jgi:hypothetical protein